MGGDYPDVWLEYIEHATDHWNQDSTTIVDIDKATVINIIKELKMVFGL
jgi:hypothetical protein